MRFSCSPLWFASRICFDNTISSSMTWAVSMLLFWYLARVSSSISEKCRLWMMFFLWCVRSSSFRSFLRSSSARFLCVRPLISARNSGESMLMSGFWSPANLKRSMTSPAVMAFETICLTVVSSSSCGFPVVVSALAKADLTVWKVYIIFNLLSC